MGAHRTTYQAPPLVRRTAFRIDWREIACLLAVLAMLTGGLIWTAAIIDAKMSAAPATSQVGTGATTTDAAAPAPTVDTLPVPSQIGAGATLPQCATENSTGCVWYSPEHGNGRGWDIVNSERTEWHDGTGTGTGTGTDAADAARHPHEGVAHAIALAITTWASAFLVGCAFLVLLLIAAIRR